MIGKDVCPTSKKVFEKKDIFIFEDVIMISKSSQDDFLDMMMLTQL